MPDAPRPARRTLPRPRDPRPTAAARGYGRDWQVLREAVLSEQPLCLMCENSGRTTAATLVDHVVPVRDGGPLLDRGNLQPLCVRCHAAKTGADVTARRRGKG